MSNDIGLSKEDWMKRCADQFIKRVPDIGVEEANVMADVCLNDMLGGDMSEMTPEDAADEELSNWSE